LPYFFPSPAFSAGSEFIYTSVNIDMKHNLNVLLLEMSAPYQLQ
jgi:hypothetical protein